MKIKLNIIVGIMLLTACNKGVKLNYQIKPKSSYQLTQSVLIEVNETKSEINNEFLIDVEDMENILVSTITLESTTNNKKVENITEAIKKNYPGQDSSWTNPNHCKSVDSKTLHSDHSKNHDTDINTAEAIRAWNLQQDLPNGMLDQHETIEVQTENNKFTTIKKFTLDSVKNRIAYLSYDEDYRNKNEALAIQMNNAGKTIRKGKLEYDIANEYYRLIQSKVVSDIGDEDSDSKDLNKTIKNINMWNETTITIALHEK